MASPLARAPAAGSAATELAKAAFRRLVRDHQEPTPENYAKAYAQEAGPRTVVDLPTAEEAAHPSSRSQQLAWAGLVERVARNLERGGRQWTAARRKESLKRVFDGSRSDPQRLQQRLQSLMKAWEEDLPADGVELGEGFESIVEPATLGLSASAVAAGGAVTVPAPLHDNSSWTDVVAALEGTVRAALPAHEAPAAALANRLGAAARTLAEQGLSAEQVAHVAELCRQARLLLGQRHHLVRQLGSLCQELGAGLSDMAEEGSWVQGQCEAVVASLASPEGGEPNLRMVRHASAVLADARQRQHGVRSQRQAAQRALKDLIQNMLLEVGDLGEHTGRFHLATTAHAKAIEEASSLESLTGVVQALLADSRAVQSAVQHSQDKLQADSARAGELEGRVRELESELRRLSDEVSTDALTQVSNRRGLAQAFNAECARIQREGSTGLAVALIDIDNFKKLNDTLGHAAGDVALKSLATQVQARLRPTDHLARFGGEEFVVLIPGTPVQEAQQALTRLQRSLSEALFLHEGREVFVTFSAGVTAWRNGETLEEAMGRADTALYEAKRTGKNKTCIG